MLYFDTLPKIITTDYKGNALTLTNLMARSEIIPSLFNDPLLFYSYDTQEGDKPEIIANKYYGDSYRYWLVCFANQILDPQWDFALDSQVFNSYIAAKYEPTVIGATTITANSTYSGANNGQTIFTVPSYDIGHGQLRVYNNGVRIYDSQYTETSNTTITLNSGASNTDSYLFSSYGYNTELTTSKLYVTANAGQTVFTTPAYTVGSAELKVFWGGILSYTESSPTTITLNTPASAGDSYLFEIDGHPANPYYVIPFGSSRQMITLTSPQQTFTVGTYVPGKNQIRVWLNGIRQYNVKENSPTSITIQTTTTSAGDVLMVEIYGYLNANYTPPLDPSIVLSYATGTVEEYRKIITTTDSNSLITTSKTIIITESVFNSTLTGTTIQTFPDGSTVTQTITTEAISIYDYEVEQNEKKRSINLINSAYTSQIESQFQSLMGT